MQYSEQTIPEHLAPLVCTVWHLRVEGEPGTDVLHDAVPDGCIEIIARHSGDSHWQDAQPQRFVAGLCTAPATLRMSSDATFTGIRLWPWAWNQIGAVPCPAFHNRWLPLEDASTPAELIDGGHDKLMARLERVFRGLPVSDIAKHVPASQTPGEVAERTGRGARFLQRWFAREIGLPPRQYFRLLRFQKTVASDPGQLAGIADRAAAAGYADQSHMTREFKQWARGTPGRIGKRALGPFVDRSDTV